MIGSIFKKLLSGFVGFLLFIFVLVIINIIGFIFNIPVVDSLVGFLNRNLLLIIIIAILYFIGGLLRSLVFPLNLGFPLFDATAGVLVASFFFGILQFADELLGTDISGFLNPFIIIIYILVFFIIIIMDYLSVFSVKRHRTRRSKRNSE